MAKKKTAQADDIDVASEAAPKATAPAPAKPKRANLTNKAGAGATPLEKDVKGWLKIGWFRVE